MVRQAHTYLVGAVSGATLIAIAIAAFVLLVSAQVFGDWPIAGLGGSKETAVERGQQLGAAAPSGSDSTGRTASGAAPAAPAGADAGRAADAPRGGAGAAPAGAAGGGDAAAGGGSQDGSGDSPATGPESAGVPSAPSGGGSSGGSGGSGGSGSGGGGGGGGATTASSPSQAVTETVNKTVTTVDQTVTGGALEETGVTGVTEEVVNGVAGPESAVGKTVDGVAGTVGGLLNPKR